MADIADFKKLIAGDHGLVVVSTLRDGGTIASSVVNAGVLPHPVTGETVVGMVIMGGTHEDFAEYDRVMLAEKRTAVLLRPERVYSNPGQ